MSTTLAFGIAPTALVLVAAPLIWATRETLGGTGAHQDASAEMEKPVAAHEAAAAGSPPDTAGGQQPSLEANRPEPGASLDAETLRRLAWGPPATNGLRAACQFLPSQETYRDGEAVKRQVVFHNSGREPLRFSVAGSNSGGLTVLDEQDQAVPLRQLFAYGTVLARTFRLLPGHAAELDCMAVGMGASIPLERPLDTVIPAKPGSTCRVRLRLKVTDLNGDPAKGHAASPEFELTAGEVRFRIVAPATTAQ